MISVETRYIPSSMPDGCLPALGLQVTRLVDSYMVWVGTTEGQPEEVDRAPLHGRLARDWACAMPAIENTMVSSGTSLFRSPHTNALSMAQRLARRFRKQIFLSVDVPVEILSGGQGTTVLVDMERGIVDVLKGMESTH